MQIGKKRKSVKNPKRITKPIPVEIPKREKEEKGIPVEMPGIPVQVPVKP